MVVDKLKAFAQSTQDFAPRILHRSENSKRRSPVLSILLSTKCYYYYFQICKEIMLIRILFPEKAVCLSQSADNGFSSQFTLSVAFSE